MKKLVLIDGFSIAFRAFYGLPLLTNSSGLYTNAVYGFAMMLLKLLEEEKPTHMLVAFDAGKTTFRHEEYQSYKDGREKAPDELSQQIPLLKELLDTFGIRHFQLNNYEADDIIGTLAHSAEANEGETLIVSGDKDLFQLVNERVQVLHPRKGVTEADRYDVQAIADRYGITPLQIIDLKGLMGDPSDNIPGIPGVGEKTALKMLQQYPTVEEILQHIDELPGKKLQEKVQEYQAQALLSKRLATIHTSVPLDFRIDDLALSVLDTQRLAELFKRLGFKTLLNRIANQADGEPLSQTERAEIAVHILDDTNQAQAEAWLQQENIALFVETTEENPHRADVVGLAIAAGEQNLYISLEQARKWQALCDWLADEQRRKIAHDAKKITIALANAGLETKGITFDTLLAAYLLNPGETEFALSDVVKRFTQSDLVSDEEVYGKGVKRRALEGEELAHHLAHKVRHIHSLYSVLEADLKKYGLYDLLLNLELPLTFVLAEMEQKGIHINQTHLDELGVELAASIERLTKEIYELAGTEFNINSPKQLGEILFDKLGLPTMKKTKTGYSTSADVLEKLAPQHEIVDKILHFRQVTKLQSTYIEGLKKEVGADGKIHTQFNQTIAATGRLSSTEPNLQNIPIRLEEGRRIRQAFVPQEGWLILAADYSQVELRVLAHLCQDNNLRSAFKKGLDIHTQTAMDVFEVPATEVTSLMRRQAKAVNFGIVYGISDYGLSQNLNITRKEAQSFIDRYFATYPGVQKYMDGVIHEAKQEGFVTTLLHRRRYLPDIHSSNFNLRSLAERMAMNTPIQGTAADIIKYAMIHLDRRMKEQKLQSNMLLQVHDELIFEVPPEELATMQTLVREVMENAIPLSVPLQVDVNVGKTWYEAK